MKVLETFEYPPSEQASFRLPAIPSGFQVVKVLPERFIPTEGTVKVESLLVVGGKIKGSVKKDIKITGGHFETERILTLRSITNEQNNGKST